MTGFVVLDTVNALFCAILAAATLFVAVTDLERFEIPDGASAAILAGGLWWTLQYFGLNEHVLIDMVARVILASGFLLALRTGYRLVRDNEGLGLGDVKLLGAGAAWISWPYIVLMLLVASVSALTLVVLRSLLLREKLQADIAVPFGAFLAPAIWIAWFVQIASY